MVDITVILTAKDPASLPELRELLTAHVLLSRGEPGCVRFEAYESQSVSGAFVLIERWESQSDLDVHRTATGFTTIYAPKVLPLVDRVPHICSVLPGT
jgi:quinol monooxygenase YgiN